MNLTALERDLLIDVLNSHMEAYDNDAPEDRPEDYPKWVAVYEKLVAARNA